MEEFLEKWLQVSIVKHITMETFRWSRPMNSVESEEYTDPSFDLPEVKDWAIDQFVVCYSAPLAYFRVDCSKTSAVKQWSWICFPGEILQGSVNPTLLSCVRKYVLLSCFQ